MFQAGAPKIRYCGLNIFRSKVSNSENNDTNTFNFKKRKNSTKMSKLCIGPGLMFFKDLQKGMIFFILI